MHNVRLFPPGFKQLVRQRRSSYDPVFGSGVWRYLELLPSIERGAIATLGEGNMPLYESPSGVMYFHLGMNPTGSFTDLGMTVAVSAAKASGATAVACARAGDAARSMAAYAARAGLKAHIASPESPAAREAVYVDDDNPYRIEGEKCAVFSLLEARAWRVPDCILLAGRDARIARAFGKGLHEARALGLIDRLPRVTVARSTRAVEPDADVVVILDSHSQYGVDPLDDPVLASGNRRTIGA